MGMLRRLDEKMERWRGNRAALCSASTEDSSMASAGWSTILSQVIASALVAATLVLVVIRYSGIGSPQVVAFDIIKYANSQRAVAAKFLSGNGQGSEDVAPLLLDVSKRTRAVISEVAGPGTLVVIRQSVVQGEIRDITDAVLTRLNLPTDVPTADPTRHVIDIAPTLLGSGPKVFSDIPEPAEPDSTSQLP